MGRIFVNLYLTLGRHMGSTKSVLSACGEQYCVRACIVRRRGGPHTINVRPFRPLAFLSRRRHRLIGNVIYITNI